MKQRLGKTQCVLASDCQAGDPRLDHGGRSPALLLRDARLRQARRLGNEVTEVRANSCVLLRHLHHRNPAVVNINPDAIAAG